MYKSYILMTFLASILLGLGIPIPGQSVLNQNFGYNDYSDDSYPDYSSNYNKDPRDDKKHDRDSKDRDDKRDDKRDYRDNKQGPPGPECQNTLTSHPFSINTDMMRPVLYLDKSH